MLRWPPVCMGPNGTLYAWDGSKERPRSFPATGMNHDIVSGFARAVVLAIDASGGAGLEPFWATPATTVLRAWP